MSDATAEQHLRKAIGARIAQLRAARGVTQEQLAERVGAASQTIRRIERGRTTPPLARLLDIAHALGVQLVDLFADVSTEPPTPPWDPDEWKVIEVWRATPPKQRPLLLDVMKRFAAPR